MTVDISMQDKEKKKPFFFLLMFDWAHLTFYGKDNFKNSYLFIVITQSAYFISSVQRCIFESAVVTSLANSFQKQKLWHELFYISIWNLGSISLLLNVFLQEFFSYFLFLFSPFSSFFLPFLLLKFFFFFSVFLFFGFSFFPKVLYLITNTNLTFLTYSKQKLCQNFL